MHRQTEKQRKERLRLELMHLQSVIKDVARIDNSKIIDQNLIEALKFIIHLSNKNQIDSLTGLLGSVNECGPGYIDEEIDKIYQKQNNESI